MGKASYTRVAIDVSAKSLQVAVESIDGGVADHTFENTDPGHRALIDSVTKKGRSARVVLEATGTYSLDLALRLAAHKRIEVMVLNPKAARKFAEAQMRRAKTDQVDARSLLDFLRCMPFTAWTPPAEKKLQLRALTRRIAALTAERVAEKNRLEAASATTETPKVVLVDIQDSIDALEKRRDALIDAALELVRGDAELKQALASVSSIKGIKDRSGVALLGELLLLPQDMSPDEVVAHCGLDPRPKQSGTRDAPRRISKIGNSVVRGALFMPALCAARFEPSVRGFYERLLARNKPKFVAITAVMRRILRVLWVLLLRKSTFDGARFAPPARVPA
jgi:transposase